MAELVAARGHSLAACGREPCRRAAERSARDKIFATTASNASTISMGQPRTRPIRPVSSIRRGDRCDTDHRASTANRSRLHRGRWLESLPIGVPGELCVAGRWGRARLLAPSGIERVLASRLRHSGRRSPLPDRRRRTMARKRRDRVRRDVRISQVKVRGYRIELGEIEEVLTRPRSVDEASWSSRRAEQESGPLWSLRRAKAGGDARRAMSLRHLERELAPHMVPSSMTCSNACRSHRTARSTVSCCLARGVDPRACTRPPPRPPRRSHRRRLARRASAAAVGVPIRSSSSAATRC